MAQQLSDKVAQDIMGEIDTVTKRIDKQIAQLTEFDLKIIESLEQFNTVSNIALNKTREVAGQVIHQSVSEAHVALATAIKTTAQKVASAAATKSAAKWVSVAVFVATSSMMFVGLSAYNFGKSAGEKVGYTKAVDEKIAVAWANTAEGIVARKLSLGGYVINLLQCDLPGWKTVKKDDGEYCSPNAAKEGQHGWRIKVKE